MRSIAVALLIFTALLSAPLSVGHDADAVYSSELIVLMGDGTGNVDLIMTMPGWTCGNISSTSAGPTFTHEVTCAPPPVSVPGFFPGCNQIYAGAIAWFPTPGVPMDHFPTPSLIPVGLLKATTSCMSNGLVQDDISVTTPAPGIQYTGKLTTNHIDAVRCVAEETWVLGTTSWVAQCAVNAFFVGTGP